MPLDAFEVTAYLKDIYDNHAEKLNDSDNIDKDLQRCFISIDQVIKELNATTNEDIETITQCTSSFIVGTNEQAEKLAIPMLGIDTDIDDSEMERAYMFYHNPNAFSEVKSSGCFIATAAFGSKYSEEVLVLKRWRDLFLLKTKYGQIIVKIYYYFSPPIAQLIKNNRFLKKTVINFLKPIIYLLRSKYDNKT